MIGNSKSTSWGRNLIAPVDIDTCTYGVVLALLSPNSVSRKFLILSAEKETFTLTFTVSRSFLY